MSYGVPERGMAPWSLNEEQSRLHPESNGIIQLLLRKPWKLFMMSLRPERLDTLELFDVRLAVHESPIYS